MVEFICRLEAAGCLSADKHLEQDGVAESCKLAIAVQAMLPSAIGVLIFAIFAKTVNSPWS